MKDLRLLQILPSLESGGVEQGVVDIAKGVVENGDTSFVMSNGGLIISDIDNKSSAFMDFSEAKGLKYFTWLERPKNPFYIPGGIGVMKKGDGSL